MDFQVSEEFGLSLNMPQDSDNSTDVKNDHSVTKELDLHRSAIKINNGNCFEHAESYLMNSENTEWEGSFELLGDGIAMGDETAGVMIEDETITPNNTRGFRSRDDDNDRQVTGLHNSQGQFRFSEEMKILTTAKLQKDSMVETDSKLAETTEKQESLGRDEVSLSVQSSEDLANPTRTPATNLETAIGMMEENLDQLRNLYIKQEIENSMQILESNPAKQDHDLINCLQRDLFSYEQQLLMIQSDLQLAQQHIEVLNTENQNLAAHLAYERQMGALCLQSVTDQLTSISTMMETKNGSDSGSPSLTTAQQTTLKAEIGRLVKVLEVEELRLMKSLGSNISGSTERQLAHNCFCLKPIEQSSDTKQSSTGVFYQKRINPTSVGMVRCHSAPVKTTSPHSMSLANSNGLGQGKDYLEILYSDIKHRHKGRRTGADEHQSDRNSAAELLTIAPFSALNDLHIIEIQQDGNFVRLANSSNTMDYQLGNYILQQNIGGHPVAVFRFPPRVRCSTLAKVTVWSEGCDTALHCPPSDFIFKGKQKWSTGSHVSTILCQPNGRAIAWSTALPKLYFHQSFISCTDGKDLSQLTKANDSKNSVFGRKTIKNSLHMNKLLISPECQASEKIIKPSLKHTTIPGLPFAGASGQRLGSASLRRYQTRPFSATQL